MQGYSPKLPLQIDEIDGVYLMNKTPIESIKQNLKMLLLTNPGERMMNTDYGVGLRRSLFENKSKSLESSIVERISSQVRKYMNFLEIKNIEVFNVEDNDNALLINIEFIIKSLNVKDQLNLSIDSN
jgi:phage baseplate assembly protein W